MFSHCVSLHMYAYMLVLIYRGRTAKVCYNWRCSESSWIDMIQQEPPLKLWNYFFFFFFPHNKCVEICLCLFTVNILWTHGIGPPKQELWHVTKLIVIWRHLIVLKIGLIGEKKPHFSLLPSALFCSWGLLLQLRITSKRGWRFLELQEEDLKDFLNTYN